jgi:hypothetical protein
MSLYVMPSHFGRTLNLEELEQEYRHLCEILAFYELNYFREPDNRSGDKVDHGCLLQRPGLASEWESQR